MSSAVPPDAYRRYLHAFFARWSPLYDAFAWPIAFVYAAGAREAGAGPGRTVIDLCSGTGEIALRCARRGARVTAVDFTPSMLTRGRRKGRGLPIRFVEADARRLPFPDATFDVAVLSFALHDMPAGVRVEALREGARVAREGVVVIDYDPPRKGAARRLVLSLLGSFETAYLRGFAREGGADAALVRAELDIVCRRRPLPGWFGIWRAGRAGAPEPDQARTRRISASIAPGSSSASS